MKEKITSQVYDRHIISQGLQIQIDSYYEPIEVSLKRRIRIVLEAINPQPQDKVLDIGCGVGTFAFHCAKLKALSFGIDYSKESIKTAQILSERYGVSQNTKFIIANAFNLPFRGSSFDKIVAADFIEHITLEGKDAFLNQIGRVLKSEGICVIFTPNIIRERLAEIYWRVRHLLLGDKIPSNALHFGLISRCRFESLLRKHKFNFKFWYKDTTRPYLTGVPVMKHFLALDLLWIIKKI